MAQRGSPLAVVLLAAGQGTRMNSDLAKVLHEVAGRPLLAWSLATAEALRPEELVVVVGRDGARVEAAFAGRARFVVQREPRGTGHAVQQAEPLLRGLRGDVLVLYADVPLLRPETLARMRARRAETGAELVMLTSPAPLPGLVVRDAKGSVERIVETTDATPEELRIREGNTGVYLVSSELLWKALGQLDDHNEQGELYLTDVVGLAVHEGRRVEAIRLDDADECLGVNDRRELAAAAAVLRRRAAERLMAEGVTIVDPAHTWIDPDVEAGRDCVIEPGCVLTGKTRLGARVRVRAHSVVESSVLDDDAVVGPMAHLRPGTRLGRGARVGNFVEVKNSALGPGVKADHLSYIGDADVGEGASFGCGSVVVNYDGLEKHRTEVGARAFVGCNVNLVAPVKVGADAFVAAGSTVTRDVSPDALAVARSEQREIAGWVSRRHRARGSSAAKRGTARPGEGSLAGAEPRRGRGGARGGGASKSTKRGRGRASRRGGRKRG
jgi:bifunctional UDP-N-acetylglucosamine pyrophosphorylase/glucosamine-1-phosphate N-acetyltransferase